MEKSHLHSQMRGEILQSLIIADQNPQILYKYYFPFNFCLDLFNFLSSDKSINQLSLDPRVTSSKFWQFKIYKQNATVFVCRVSHAECARA